MVTQVSRNPRLVCNVSAVPTYSCGASSLTAVENCAESATTLTPQISSSGSIAHTASPNRMPTVSAQLPDSTMAQLVTQVRPWRSAYFPPSQLPTAPTPTTTNVTRARSPANAPSPPPPTCPLPLPRASPSPPKP